MDSDNFGFSILDWEGQLETTRTWNPESQTPDSDILVLFPRRGGGRTQITSTLSAVGGGSVSYDSNDRLTTDTIDNNGNTTLSGGVSNTYDFENRMTAHGTTTLGYDGDGNRASETVGGATTKYLVDALNPTGLPQVLDETVNGSVTRTYGYGLQRISENQLNGSTWTPSFYGYDGHGNVRFLTNSAGTVTDTYQYDAFGRLIA